MGRLAAAWNHFERATAAAREAGDSSLLAFAAGEQAYVLLDLHRSHESLEMVRSDGGLVVAARLPDVAELAGWSDASVRPA